MFNARYRILYWEFVAGWEFDAGYSVVFINIGSRLFVLEGVFASSVYNTVKTIDGAVCRVYGESVHK